MSIRNTVANRVVHEGDPLRGIPTRQVSRRVRDVIKERFQGNRYPIGETGVDARVTARTKNEISHRPDKMNDQDYRARSQAAHHLDELMSTMTRIKEAPNRKKAQKPEVASYTYGDVTFQIGDQYFTGRVNVETWNNGNRTLYDISSIKKETSPERINLLKGEMLLSTLRLFVQIAQCLFQTMHICNLLNPRVIIIV